MTRRTLGAACLLATLVACGKPATSTTPSPATNPTPSNSAPALSAVSASSSVGLQGATVFAFAAPATDADGDPLTYAWDFGDQATSTQASPTHVYQTSGPFIAKVAVSDGKASATGQTALTVKNVSGTWVWSFDDTADNDPTTRFTWTLNFTHTGATVSATADFSCNRPATSCSANTPGPFTGLVSTATPTFALVTPTQHACGVLGSAPDSMSGNVSSDVGSLTSVRMCSCAASCPGPGNQGPFARP